MSEQFEPIPPRHGEDEHWLTEPMLVCPVCGGLVRRNQTEPPSPWRCDLHGEIAPEIVYREEEEC